MKRLPKHRYPRNISNLSKVKEDENLSFLQRNKIDITIVITVVPAICYLFVYFYQFSLFNYYNIPIELINIELKNVVWFLFIFAAGIVTLTLASFLLSTSKKFELLYNDSRKSTIIQLILMLLILVTTASYILDIKSISVFNQTIKLSKEIFILSVVFLFLFTLLCYMTRIQWRIKQNKTMTMHNKIIHVILTCIALLTMALYMGHYIPYFSGYHYIIKENKSTYSVVLTTYKDNFIVAPVDLDKKVIIPKFSFIKIETEKDGKGQLEKIETGRLTVDKPNTLKELTSHK